MKNFFQPSPIIPTTKPTNRGKKYPGTSTLRGSVTAKTHMVKIAVPVIWNLNFQKIYSENFEISPDRPSRFRWTRNFADMWRICPPWRFRRKLVWLRRRNESGRLKNSIFEFFIFLMKKLYRNKLRRPRRRRLYLRGTGRSNRRSTYAMSCGRARPWP